MKKMQIALGLLLAGSMLAQVATDTPEAHVATAKTLAGDDYQSLFNFVCAAPAQRGGAGGGGGAAGAGRGQGGQGGGQAPAAGQGAAPATPRAGGGGGGQRGTPDRATWHAEPVKVFDNLYWFGQTEYSVWALTTSDGIIVFDAIFDYSIEDEVDAGMKKMGLDPTKIKYAVISHSHPDHFGGGKFLQDKYGTKVYMAAEDWNVLETTYANQTRPKRDLVATDGQKFTLGDTTVTMYFTPGHTPGTISSVFQVKDNGKIHTVALWGGMGLNNDRATLTQYITSAKHFQDVAKQAGADIILSNHTDWDRSKNNLPLLVKGQVTPNPYVTNNASVLRYLKVAEECATAKVMRLP